MQAESFQRKFLLLVVVAISGLFLWMIRDFLMPLLFAALFASLMRPVYLRFSDWTKGWRRTSALLTVLLFVFLVILPLVGFVGIVAKQAFSVAETVKPWVEENLSTRQDVNERLQKLPGYKYIAPYRDRVVQRVSSAVSRLGKLIFEKASSITAGTLMFFVHFAILLYAMFFFFLDGPRILERMLYYMPLNRHDEKRLLDGFRSMARATIKGIVVIGAVQGTLAGLGFWAAGIGSALFWGTVMAVLSVVPNIGSALVWLPAGVILLIKGKTAAGALLLIWCAVVVGSADNVLRPILIGKDTRVHELLVLISTLGGLSMMGLGGFVLGPVLALLFLTVWDIYGRAFKDVLPSTG